MRRCNICGAPLVPLLFTAVCDQCNAPPAKHGPARGYIVWRMRPWGCGETVFKNEESATRWRAAAGLEHFPIRAVLSPKPIQWKPYDADIEWALLLYEIFPTPDAKTDGPNWAYVEEP